MNSILITGANGFIGRSLTRQLETKNYSLRLASRAHSEMTGENKVTQNVFLDLENDCLASDSIFKDIDIVIHLAGQVHANQKDRDGLYKVNADGTASFAEASMLNGVKLFVFISTVKVHGNVSPEQIFSENSPLTPQDDYAKSKLQGEKALINICENSEMQFVILRPPLVYGPGVKANFLKLMTLIDKRLPMPVANFNNLRSYIYVENLCHIIEGVMHREACKNQVYLVKDCDLSTKNLVLHISDAFEKPANIFNVPVQLLENIARIINKKKDFERLYKSFVIDDTRLRDELGWVSSVDVPTAIANTVDWYNHRQIDSI